MFILSQDQKHKSVSQIDDASVKSLKIGGGNTGRDRLPGGASYTVLRETIPGTRCRSIRTPHDGSKLDRGLRKPDKGGTI